MFYILVLTIVALIMLSTVLVVLYIREIGRKGKMDDLEYDPTTSKVFDKAQIKSQKVLEEAYTKARQIISDANDYVKNQDSQLVEALEKAQEVYIREYNNALKSSEDKANKMIQSIPQDIKISLISVIDSFRVSLTDEIKRAQGDANKVITDAYKEALASVEKYKADRMKDVDNSILMIIKDVAEKVLGKTLSIEEHEKLVHKALEEARRQKIF